MLAEDLLDQQTEFLIAKVSANPIAMLMLAKTLLLPRGQTSRALSLCDDALKLAPDDPEVKALVQTIGARSVGGWYFTMVQDHGRHALYAEAFRKIITANCTVLDIGAGTGLFAMMAAREGAGQVIACERDPHVADAARKNVENNGYSDRVRIITKDSRDLVIGLDLPEPADVLLWDNLSNDMLGAGGLDTIEDARQRLIKPSARIIPQRCELRVALVLAKPASNYRMATVEGFDLTAFNRFSPTQITLGRSKCERRSEAATIFEFDHFREAAFKSQRNKVIVSSTGGEVNGIVQWLRFHITDGVTYDTGDDEGVAAFGLQYHAVEPFFAERERQFTIAGAHDRERTWFWIDDPE